MTQTHELPSFTDVLQTRRSVRNYTSQMLDAASVEHLLAAAVRAPTAIHREAWGFVVIQDVALLRRISDEAKSLLAADLHNEHLDRGSHDLAVFELPEFNVFYNAGTLIVICATQPGPFAAADCWLAAENLILMAAAMELGTCVIGSAVEAINSSGFRAELGLSDGIKVVAPIIVGRPAGSAVPTARKPPNILRWVGRQPML